MDRLERIIEEIQGNFTSVLKAAHELDGQMTENTKFLAVSTIAVLLVLLINIVSIFFCWKKRRNKNKEMVVNSYSNFP